MKAPYLGLQHEAIEADDGADPTMGSAASSSAVGLRKAPPRRSFVLNLRMERQRDVSIQSYARIKVVGGPFYV